MCRAAHFLSRHQQPQFLRASGANLTSRKHCPAILTPRVVHTFPAPLIQKKNWRLCLQEGRCRLSCWCKACAAILFQDNKALRFDSKFLLYGTGGLNPLQAVSSSFLNSAAFFLSSVVVCTNWGRSTHPTAAFVFIPLSFCRLAMCHFRGMVYSFTVVCSL